MADSIKVGPGMQAFAAGVVAGDEALALARQESQDGPFEELLGRFWLAVGIAITGRDFGDEVNQGAFVLGATTRAPERTGFHCYFKTSNAQFHSQDPDWDDFDLDWDTEERIAGIRWVLRRVADDVASGAEEAPIRDINGHQIGSFSINEA